MSIIDQHLLAPTVVTHDSTGTRGTVSFTVLGDVQDTQARLDISVHMDFHVNSRTAERSLYAGAGAYRGWTLAVSYHRASAQHTTATAEITAPA